MKKVILIVTENHEFKILLESFLSRSYEVKVAGSNNEAISEINNGFVPGLVLSDTLVPISESLSLISSVKASFSNTQIPVILMAGKDRSNEINDLLKSGATDYIYKPFSLSELETRIMNLFKNSVVSV
jgi:two-component system sensor histidine kinase ChiS